jgi:electron transfer flavoprotein beta subunit
MNILVILRAIQDPLGLTVNRRAEKVFVNREQYVFNPSDRNALEAALKLGGEVAVVAFGDEPAEQVLRDARAIGAARAIQIKDATLNSLDACTLTLVLRRVVEQVSADLVLLGGEVLDADLAQIGPRLAQALDWPLILDAHRVEARDGVVRAIAPRGAVFHHAEADLPAVITIARDSNKPRYANAGEVITVYTRPDAVQVWNAADLGLSESELAPVTEVRGESFPPEREFGKKLEGDAAGQLAEILRRI